ncbi:MAG: CHAT domain protein [Betaproteobacteria bacterium ADurb.Bin341]|nr:MAG: CHAT domain protein [Betaproteobacteria bacterium ADurb.Bin341]
MRKLLDGFCLLALLLTLLATPAFAQRGRSGGSQQGGQQVQGAGREWQRLGRELSEALAVGDLERSENLARQRVAMAEKGSERWLGNAYRGLGTVLMRRGRYAEAETIFRKALSIVEQENGRLSHQAIRTQSSLVSLLSNGSRLAEADALAREALERQMNYAPRGIDVVNLNNQLGNIQRRLGRLDEAEAYFNKADSAEVSDAPINASDAGTSPQALGIRRSQTAYFRSQLEMRRGHLAQAEEYARKSLEMILANAGERHPEVARNKILLGNILFKSKRLPEAEAQLVSAVVVSEQTTGRSSRETAYAVYSLGLVLAAQKRQAEAGPLFQRALELARHNGAVDLFADIGWAQARFLKRHGQSVEALRARRDVLDAIDWLFVQTRGLDDATREAYLRKYGAFYGETLALLLELHRTQPTQGYDREALSVVSRTQSRIFTEMLRQADVGALANDPAFKSLRSRQEALRENLAEQRRVRVVAVRDDENDGTATVTKADPQAQARLDAIRTELEAKLAATTRELEAVEAELWAKYPRYMELMQPRPVTVEQLQKRLLKPGETLVTYFLLRKEALAFVVSRDRFQVIRLPVSRPEIAAMAAAARAPEESVSSGLENLKRLDPELLYRLYQAIFQPLEPYLKKGQRLLVIGDGPLHTLPLEMLVTRYGDAERKAFEKARQEGKVQFAEYGGLPYLAQQHSFSYLPSLSALASLRLYRKSVVSYDKDLISFADPIFEQSEESKVALTRTLRGAGDAAIPRLPETADEARDIAAIVGARSQLFLRSQAQEHTVKTINLKTTRFLHFATHGLLGGEFVRLQEIIEGSENGQEPSGEIKASNEDGDLVLSPDANRRRLQGEPALLLSLSGDLQGEDGLLTMREIIERLDLNVKLVVLSACNTVGEGAQANNGEGFAGLTRAFMFAGAQGLLVSHWSVESQATRDLITQTFRRLQGGQDNAAAIDSARTVIRDSTVDFGGQKTSRAHPFFWAPFVHVGE